MTTGKKALQWEKVPVFISSTFNDMHAERDYLVKRVFPELQEWCERRKLRLVDIDLRWGVTEQDATHNKNVVRVCLDRIDDCRPFFLCFLGQRRGWVPKEGEVSDETFATFPDLRPVVGAASVTEMEILHALINPFHQSLAGKTEKPVEYYERAKYAFFYLRDPSYLSQLPADPQMLRETYTNEWVEDAVERDAHDRELKRWREQEIPESNRPCHFYKAKWDPNEKTPENMIPLQCPSSEPANIKRWQRQWQKAGVTATGLNILDDQVEASSARTFNARLSRGRLSDFKWEEAPLSRIIIKELQEAIAERFHEHSEVEDESELQKEIDQQVQFLFTASEGFIPREGDFADIDDYVGSDSNQLFVLTAEGGMGKSTLLANWVDRYRSRIEGRADQSIHFRFIGQSDGTTAVYSLLRLLLTEIKEVAQKFDEEIPLDPVKLRNEWPALLQAVGKRGKTVIVIDALNQLDSGLTDVGWLPRQLPDNIKLIVSFKRGDPSAENLYERFREGNQVRLSKVKAFESLDDRRQLVRAYLSQFLKELDEQHLTTLINLHGAENPLYLKVVLSELRVFGDYGNLAAKIRSDFGDNPVSAFVRVLDRLENDSAYSPIDPKQAVPLLFGVLAHARHGLSVDELASLLIQGLGLEGTDEWREAAVDTVNLFLRQVRSSLARREGRYDFFFESFKVAAVERYARKGDEQAIIRKSSQQWHRLLADYFKSLPTWQEAAFLAQPSSRQIGREPNRRKVAELPHHLLQAEQLQELEATICDLDFVDAKCAAGLVYELVTECEAANSALNPAGQAGSRADELESLRAMLNKFAQVLADHPEALFGLLHHEARGLLRELCTTHARDGRWKKPWIRTAPISISGPAPSKSIISVDVRSQYRFGGAHLAALSADANTAFYLKRVGQIAVVDTANGRELGDTISVRPFRPLCLSASADAGLLALAFENGEADVLRLDLASGHHEFVCTLGYLVPKFDTPVLRWLENTLWLQRDRQTITAFELRGVRHIELAQGCAGELSAVAHVSGACIVAMRQDRGSTLMVIPDEGAPTVRHLQSIDVVCLEGCGHDQIVCGVSDYSIVVLDVRTLDERFTIPVKELPVCVSGSESAAIWATDHGHLYRWHFTASGSEDAMDDTALLGFGERVLCIAPGNAGMMLVTEERVTCFSAAARAQLYLTYPLERIFVLNDDSIALAQRRDETLWLVDARNDREVCLGSRNSELVAIDEHHNVLLAAYGGTSVRLDWSSFGLSDIFGVPAGICCVAPASGGGFWLIDIHGVISFLDPNFSHTPVARMKSQAQAATYQTILSWPGWLIVKGYGAVDEWQIIAAEDTNEFLVFFRVMPGNPPRIEPYGVRVFLKQDGFVQTAVFDRTMDCLNILTRRDGDAKVRVRSGSPKAFIDKAEAIHDIQCRERVSHMVPTGGSDPMGWLLLHGGILSFIEAGAPVPRAVLVVEGQITSLSSNDRGTVVIAQSSRQLFGCHVSRGDMPYVVSFRGI